MFISIDIIIITLCYRILPQVYIVTRELFNSDKKRETIEYFINNYTIQYWTKQFREKKFNSPNVFTRERRLTENYYHKYLCTNFIGPIANHVYNLISYNSMYIVYVRCILSIKIILIHSVSQVWFCRYS